MKHLLSDLYGNEKRISLIYTKGWWLHWDDGFSLAHCDLLFFSYEHYSAVGTSLTKLTYATGYSQRQSQS